MDDKARVKHGRLNEKQENCELNATPGPRLILNWRKKSNRKATIRSPDKTGSWTVN